MTNSPPYRADQVGSLLRPAALREARAKRARGEIAAAALQELEDREIARVIARQEAVGLEAVTDGEFRRRTWMTDFIAGLDGISLEEPPANSGSYPTLKVTGKIGYRPHPMLAHFNYVKALTKVAPKMCIPSPTHIATVLRDWRETVDQKVYPSLDAVYADAGPAYRQAIRAFADAGCRYLQIDDCNFAFLCDPAMRDQLKKRGDDPDKMLQSYVDVVNEALRDRPAGLSVTMHSCRGNTGRGFASGGYEWIAEALFGGVNVDGFFLEFDDDRSGGFEPLRFLPKNKVAALGLVSTKRKELEPADELKRRVDEAAKFVEPDRLSLCPQCGFASSQNVDRLTEDEQWAKLGHVVAVAHEIWN